MTPRQRDRRALCSDRAPPPANLSAFRAASSLSPLSFPRSVHVCVVGACMCVCALSLVAFTFSPRCHPVAGNWSAGKKTGATTSRTSSRRPRRRSSSRMRRKSRTSVSISPSYNPLFTSGRLASACTFRSNSPRFSFVDSPTCRLGERRERLTCLNRAWIAWKRVAIWYWSTLRYSFCDYSFLGQNDTRNIRSPSTINHSFGVAR